MPQNDDSRPTTPPPATPATSYSVQKADQIASRFFIKFLLIVVSSRSTVIEHGPRSAKFDKWTPDTDIHRDHMRTFRSLSTMSTLPSLTLHTVLTIPDLGTNKVLVALDSVGSRLRIEPTPRAILLETWTLTATQPQRGLDEKLQTMDDDFKKSFQSLMQRRRGKGGRAGDANPPAEELAQLPDEPGPGVRRPGLSFRSGNAIRGRPNPASGETEPFATPPGDSTASDGSGYAGIVGQLDLDSPEGQLPASPFGPRPTRPSSNLATHLGSTATTTSSNNTPTRSSDSSTGTTTTTGASTASRARQRGLEEDVAEGRYEGDNESSSRGPRYTSVLRRDATLRPQDRHSSGSNPNSADGVAK
ncbi:5536_t:CDS:2, partial [Acaulospora colombiana]